MFFLVLLPAAALLLAAIFLDCTRKISLVHPLPLSTGLILCCNLPLLGTWAWQYGLAGCSPFQRTLAMTLAGLFLLYWWLRLNIAPVRDGKPAAVRLKVMIGGRFLVYTALWAMVLAALLLTTYPRLLRMGFALPLLVGNGVCGAAAILFLLWNGILRMFFTSRRLSIPRRIIMVVTMWVPVLNLFVLLSACRLVSSEYDYGLYKENVHLTRADSDLCQTKYPLVMVHGVLFRDLRFFNYWGRIPKELTRYGATIYYGNQAAVGTVINNAEDIRRTILQVVEESGCEKVNIIAHSKGGLDARYAISVLDMEDYVASLTTICTPHRGCRFVDKACAMPDALYRLIARIFDSVFHGLFQESSNFYAATRQFSTEATQKLNNMMPDSPNVYYQSYATIMSSPFSDPVLTVPYCIIKPIEGPNDGLVSVESAKWGNFRGTLSSSTRRGISHGDIIDLQREEYKGFDVVEAYVGIVSDLKQMGY